MATFKPSDPIDELHGKLGGVVHRQKKFRAPNGKVIAEAKKEVFKVQKPRDRKKKPPKGAELESINRFQEAQLFTSEVINSVKPGSNPTPEQIARYEDFNNRYLSQLDGPADPEAPIDPKTHAPKHYFTLRAFISGIRMQQLKLKS